jgi:serine protease AprX
MANLQKTNYEMIQLLRRIGSNSTSPNNMTGYGIPMYKNLLSANGLLPKDEEVLISNPVYHNPIILTLGLKWQQQPVHVQLFDATGKIVYQQTLNSPAQEQILDVAAQRLKNGLYLCRLRSGALITTVRFVKI